MINFICKHSLKQHIKIIIDGQIYKPKTDNFLSILSLDLKHGIHKIIVQQLNSLDNKFWWLKCFNLIKALYMFKFFGYINDLGYDSNHANISFEVIVKDDNQIEVELKLITKKSPYRYSDSTYDFFEIKFNGSIRSVLRSIEIKNYNIKWKLVNFIPSISLSLLFYILFLANWETWFPNDIFAWFCLLLIIPGWIIFNYVSVVKRKNVESALLDEIKKEKFYSEAEKQ